MAGAAHATSKAHSPGWLQYQSMVQQAQANPDDFWATEAQKLYWASWDQQQAAHASNFNPRSGTVFAQWFAGCRTNIAYNALDQQIQLGRGEKTAFHWEGNSPGEERSLSYLDVKAQVCQLANYLRAQGVRKGDRVVIYLPMVPELPIAMLACARIGAIHSVVFGGFSSDALAQRILDCEPKIVITCSAVMRATKRVELKQIADDALRICQSQFEPECKTLVLFNDRASTVDEVPYDPSADVWWADAVQQQDSDAPVEWVDAEDPLFILYTSGSTGKPKGVLHTTGGYMVWTATTYRLVFDHREDDVLWTTADCGWITGHSYIVYGPMLNGASQVLFEGVPTHPTPDRIWQIVDKYMVSILYTAPTAIRSLEKAGDEYVHKTSRQSLRILGTVGEPIQEKAWRWFKDVVGGGRCPIVDTWWQTETGGHMIAPLPYAIEQKPGSCTLPLPGVQPAILDDNGQEIGGVGSGVLVIKTSWPGMMRSLYNDHERFETNYFWPYPGYYFTGDSAYRDENGYYWITGRVDDVINVSGHRLGTAEVEGALVNHTACAEAAVVGTEHELKGEAIYAYVMLRDGFEYSDELRAELRNEVRQRIGPFASPDTIHWAPGLPKTRSGKIMRRVLRKIASGQEEELGDTSTLADPSVVDTLIQYRGV